MAYLTTTPSGLLVAGGKPCGTHAALEVTLTRDNQLINLAIGCGEKLKSRQTREKAFDTLCGQKRIIIAVSRFGASCDEQAAFLNALHDAFLTKKKKLAGRWLGVELDPTRPDRDTRKNRHHKTTI